MTHTYWSGYGSLRFFLVQLTPRFCSLKCFACCISKKYVLKGFPLEIIKEGNILILPNGHIVVQDFIFNDATPDELRGMVLERVQKALVVLLVPQGEKPS